MPFEAIDGTTLNSDGFVFETISKVTAWPLSLDGPGLIAVAHVVTVFAPPSSRTPWSAPLVKLGASLTDVTVTVTVAVSLPPLPSEIV